MTQEALMKKREWGDREERNTNMGREIEWVAAVGNTLGSNTSDGPLRNHVIHSSESSLRRMEEGESVIEDRPPGVRFPPPTPSPPHTDTRFGITPAYLGPSSLVLAGRKQQRKSLMLKMVAHCKQDTV